MAPGFIQSRLGRAVGYSPHLPNARSLTVRQPRFELAVCGSVAGSGCLVLTRPLMLVGPALHGGCQQESGLCPMRPPQPRVTVAGPPTEPATDGPEPRRFRPQTSLETHLTLNVVLELTGPVTSDAVVEKEYVPRGK